MRPLGTPFSEHEARTRRRGSLGVRALLVLSVLYVLAQVVGLVVRAGHGDSDFGNFYRTADLLNHGAGGDLYAHPDVTGQPRCIPPAGMAPFQILARLSPAAAGAVWGLLNLLLLAASLFALRRFFRRLDRHGPAYAALFPWASVVLLVLSASSIQVGQFSLLFCACWIFYLCAAAGGDVFWAGLCMALPSAIKLYPALMLTVPLASPERRRREIKYFLLGIVLACAVLPAFTVSARLPDLTLRFAQYVLLSPEGRVPQSLSPTPVSNQSLDSVLLRFLTPDSRIQARYPSLPYFSLSRARALLLANILRALILLVSLGAAVRWREGLRETPRYGILRAAALWSVTLYAILPDAKARYAAYTFLGFLPMLESAARACPLPSRLRFVAECASIVFCVVAVLGACPDILRAYGLGLAGALLLWLLNLRGMSLTARRAPGARTARSVGADLKRT